MDASATLSQLLDAAARRWPDAPMLNFFQLDGGDLSFAVVRRRSTALAAALQQAGARRGSKVAVILPNIPLFPLSWLAIARIGAVMVPLNPRFTSEELDFALRDAEVSHVIVHEDLLSAVRDVDGQLAAHTLVVTDAEGGQVSGPDGRIDLDRGSNGPWPDVATTDPVGIHYTSGTTGFPKGCVLDHSSWLIMSRVTLDMLPRAPKRILSDAPFFYIDALSECCLAMWTGAEQYVSGRVSLSQFTRWLVDFDIDYAEVWEALGSQCPDPASEAMLRERAQPLMLTSFGLRGPQRPELAMRLNATIQEMYGMTEVGLATVMPVGTAISPESDSCGLVAPQRETRVVDPETLVDVPDGTVGELWVRGPGLTHGYFNRPEVNAYCLPGDGWFRTGDLFVRDERGFHYIVGRIKDMIRRSHENIAAGEVEAALLTMPGVESGAVVGVPDPLRIEEVKAFVVLAPGRTPEDTSPEDIVQHMSRVLSPFKLPRYVEYVDSLPLTPSGKIAKAQLKATDEGRQPRGYDLVDHEWRA